MHYNIKNPLRLEDLATHTGLSRHQLERHFRQFLGESPMNCYRNIRLDHGRVLIVGTDLAIAQIAVACGFNSVNVFIRHYKKGLAHRRQHTFATAAYLRCLFELYKI